MRESNSTVWTNPTSRYERKDGARTFDGEARLGFRCQLGHQLVHARDVVEGGQIDMAGKAFAFLPVDKNLDLGDGWNVGGESRHQRGQGEFLDQHAGAGPLANAALRSITASPGSAR